MLLARFTGHLRLKDIFLQYGWDNSQVSYITDAVIRHIHEKLGHLLGFDGQWLTPEKLSQFAEVVHTSRKSRSPLKTGFGFVDGTLRRISRPSKRQQTVFNGWKPMHALKYQAVVTPDRIIVHLYGPTEGQRDDHHYWQESQITGYLEEFACHVHGNPLQIYGDPAYGLYRYLISPFKSYRINPKEKLFNKRMSKVRIAVELVFKELTQLFPYFDWCKNQNLQLQPVGLQFRVAVLLHNVHVCLHKPQIPQYFVKDNGKRVPSADPPTLEEYFHGLNI